MNDNSETTHDSQPKLWRIVLGGHDEQPIVPFALLTTR